MNGPLRSGDFFRVGSSTSRSQRALRGIRAIDDALHTASNYKTRLRLSAGCARSCGIACNSMSSNDTKN